MRKHHKTTEIEDTIDKIIIISENTSISYSDCMRMNIDELYFLYKRLYINNLMKSQENKEAYMAYEIERLGGISALYDESVNDEIAKQFNFNE